MAAPKLEGALAGLALHGPRADLADSYRGLVREFVERGEPLIPFVLEVPNDPFEAFLRRLDACSPPRASPRARRSCRCCSSSRP